MSLPDMNLAELDAATGMGWPEPGIIAPGPSEKPYPIEALPKSMKEAVTEVQAYGKQPGAMIATAALGQMALVAQGLADVARDSVLRSPCSLNALIIGESGERKTAIDGMFSRGAKEWQAEERENRMPEFSRGQAMRKALAERIQSVTKKIGALEVKGKAEAEAERIEFEQRLNDLTEQDLQLRVAPLPHLYYEDVTTEGLSYAFSTGHPSAMLASDEAGIVIGGRGMADEAALGFLTLLNRMWDGRGVVQTRKQAKAADLVGRRFSASLMLQRDLLARIVERGGRGVGFFGRYLITAPQSTMGNRFYSLPPKDGLPALDVFNARAKELLSIDLPTNEKYELVPPVMTLDKGSLDLWAAYHDTVERELSDYGDYALVRDVGAKSAENAARIACVVQIWEEGPGGSISERYMQTGISLAEWHLNEASRVFFDADKPQEAKDAEMLSAWLCSDGRAHLDKQMCLPVAKILQLGPYRLRDKARRDEALFELAEPEVSHLRLITNGRKKMLQVNPKLLKGAVYEL
ncbi:MAG TPA: DUF3987 domain-containing protein [Gammaproteobacteria bacterium]|nr:DUF3987 domain-containing protein [Gammaproteobacteria bacterium]